MLHQVFAVGQVIQIVSSVDDVRVGGYDLTGLDGRARLESQTAALLGLIDDPEAVLSA